MYFKNTQKFINVLVLYKRIITAYVSISYNNIVNAYFQKKNEIANFIYKKSRVKTLKGDEEWEVRNGECRVEI